MASGFDKRMINERESYQPCSQTNLSIMKQKVCGVLFAVIGMFVIAVSLIYSYRSTSELEKLNSLMLGLHERVSKFEENQNQKTDTLRMELKISDLSKQQAIQMLSEKNEQIFKDLFSLSQTFMIEMKSIELSKQQQAIQISVLQEKNEQIFKDLSSLTKLPTSLSDLRKDLEYLSLLKPEKESIKKDLVKAQIDIMENENYSNTKVDALEKEQRNLLINDNNLIAQVNSNLNRIDQIQAKVEILEQDQRDIVIKQNSLSTQVNSNQNHIGQAQIKVDMLEKDQIGIRQSENDLFAQVNKNSDRISLIQTKVDALEKDQQDNLTNQSSLTSQINSNINKIDQLTAQINVLLAISAKVHSLGFDVPTIQDIINSINLKINSDTFNKVEMFGPYYPNSHSIPLTVTNLGYTMFQTLEPCILSLKGRVIVTLIATGHVSTNTNLNGQISFMINRKVSLPFTNYEKWQFGVQYGLNSACPVNLTQEFILEKGMYEFSLGGMYPYSGSAVLLLHAVSFVAKVTYIS